MLRTFISEFRRSLSSAFYKTQRPAKFSYDALQFYSQFVKSGDLCFDVGAHVGSKTAILLELGARVVCVEPQPECVNILKDKYGSDPNVVIISNGVASKRSIMPLSLCGAANTISTFSEKWKTGRFRSYTWDSVVEVEVTTLDALIESFGVPRFCKVDVEGFEYEVVKGLSFPIPFICFEFTKELLSDAVLCMEHLMSVGSAEFNYVLAETPALALSNWSDSVSLLNSIRQKEEDLLWGDIYVRFDS